MMAMDAENTHLLTNFPMKGRQVEGEVGKLPMSWTKARLISAAACQKDLSPAPRRDINMHVRAALRVRDEMGDI